MSGFRVFKGYCGIQVAGISGNGHIANCQAIPVAKPLRRAGGCNFSLHRRNWHLNSGATSGNNNSFCLLAELHNRNQHSAAYAVQISPAASLPVCRKAPYSFIRCILFCVFGAFAICVAKESPDTRQFAAFCNLCRKLFNIGLPAIVLDYAIIHHPFKFAAILPFIFWLVKKAPEHIQQNHLRPPHLSTKDL